MSDPVYDRMAQLSEAEERRQELALKLLILLLFFFSIALGALCYVLVGAPVLYLSFSATLFVLVCLGALRSVAPRDGPRSD